MERKPKILSMIGGNRINRSLSISLQLNFQEAFPETTQMHSKFDAANLRGTLRIISRSYIQHLLKFMRVSRRKSCTKLEE